MRTKHILGSLIALAILSSSNGALTDNLNPSIETSDSKAPLVEKFLLDGHLAPGEKALQTHLKAHTGDDQARFGLGLLQSLRALEHLMQDLFRFGFRDLSTSGARLPIVQLPVPVNPNPQRLSYVQARKIVQNLVDDLSQAEVTLSGISDPDVKLPIHFGLIHLDLNGDGQIGQDEELWQVYSRISGGRQIKEKQAQKFLICFDRGDVHWLRGYCHLIMAMSEIYLAYDSKESFECNAHLFFRKVDSPYRFLSEGKHVHNIGRDDMDIVDVISLIHLIRWQVEKPEKMELALHHLEAMVEQSKQSWKWILSETDDDHEWLPNPKQSGVIPGMEVRPEMISAWQDLMEETGKLLAGHVLIPFWRGDGRTGVNMRNVFLHPRPLDLVLWIQGPAAAPYLESGSLSKPETWTRLQRVFAGEFVGFALWFN